MEINESLGSFKSLEVVRLKATYNIEIGNQEFEEGETIALFDKITISGLNELKDVVAARGGYGNPGLVYWETTKELHLNFSQGVFSKTHFGLLTNSKLITIEEEEPILITKTEELESNENGFLTPTEVPQDQIFVYDKETGEKLEQYRVGDLLAIGKPFVNTITTYRYNCMSGGTIARIGQRLLNGFVELEGKTRVKDDTSGLITTGIIRIPKLKLMSGLSIRLGAQANPVVANFSAVGVPVGSRNQSYVAEFIFLNDDIDSDM